MLDDLRTWADSVRHLYVRPEIERFRERSGEESEALVDAYSDWEIREAKLVHAVDNALDVADRTEEHDVELALKALQAAEILAGLHPAMANRAVVSFRTGYLLWRYGRFHEAITHLASADETLRGLDGESWRELTALSYLVICLREDKQLDEALDAAERMLRRAREFGVSACEAMGLRDRGMVKSELGRTGAAEDLRAALEIRKRLSGEEALEYAVPDVGGFLNDLGVVTRKEGQFETATVAFLELAEFQRARGDQALEARALSDLGYTYHASGEDERAARYLIEAADLADRVGEHRDPARWRRQASAFSGTAEISDFEAGAIASSIATPGDAYETASVVELLIAQGRFEEAMVPAQRALEWARENKDSSFEMSLLNDVAVCHAHRGNLDGAIPMFQQAIRLADGLKNAPASLRIRQGLATAFLRAGKPQLAADVLWSGLAFGEVLLSSTPGTETRQQVAASILGVHEIFASLLSQTGNHETMVATTEIARTRNLLGWMRAANAVGQASRAEGLREILDELRAAEVEVEVRQLARSATAQQIQTVVDRRARLRTSLDEGLVARGEAPVAWSPEPTRALRDVRARIAEAVSPGDHVLFLFSVSEGVCAAAACVDSTGVDFGGGFNSWERQDRKSALAPWFYTASPKSSSVGTEASPLERFEPAMAKVRKRLLEPLAGLLNRRPVANLVVIPQGELALLPYWDLLELTSASGSLCLAPSLEVYLLCTRRSRVPRGPTLLVPDVTGSLRHFEIELAAVRAARSGDMHERASAEDISEAAREAAVIHVAAHGVFNAENPYLGGFIVRETDPASAWFPQYVAPPRRFESRPTPDAWRLFTVAECMARLSLDFCRVAILSACESGVPRLHGGGEMTGLPNALVLAGAQSVIASLWRVHDAATAVLMHHFYYIWEGGGGERPCVAESLRDARERLRRTTRREVVALLGPVAYLPEGDHPFSNAFFADAFHCFGSL